MHQNIQENENVKKTFSEYDFLGTKEIAELMKCSLPVAREIMRSKDFPLIKVGKNLKVMASAFREWASERRA